MSDHDGGGDGEITDVDFTRDRRDVIDSLEEAIDEAHRKAVSGRVYDVENEKVRAKWFRTLGYLAGQYRQILKDAQLAELEDRVDELEEKAEQSDGRDHP